MDASSSTSGSARPFFVRSTLNICLAGVARLDPNVIEFASREHREMLVVLLAASRTNDPPKLPFGEAEGTDHRSRTPIAQRAQHT